MELKNMPLRTFPFLFISLFFQFVCDKHSPLHSLLLSLINIIYYTPTSRLGFSFTFTLTFLHLYVVPLTYIFFFIIAYTSCVSSLPLICLGSLIVLFNSPSTCVPSDHSPSHSVPSEYLITPSPLGI